MIGDRDQSGYKTITPAQIICPFRDTAYRTVGGWVVVSRPANLEKDAA